MNSANVIAKMAAAAIPIFATSAAYADKYGNDESLSSGPMEGPPVMLVVGVLAGLVVSLTKNYSATACMVAGGIAGLLADVLL